MSHIPLDQCKHGFLYRITSRNLNTGVYNAKTKGFIGIREKFGDLYLFTEYHWDLGPPHGTVRPIEILEKCQTIIDEYLEDHTENKILFNWLQERKQ